MNPPFKILSPPAFAGKSEFDLGKIQFNCAQLLFARLWVLKESPIAKSLIELFGTSLQASHQNRCFFLSRR